MAKILVVDDLPANRALVAHEVVCVIALFADEAGFFDDDEMHLLTELAGDIGFAMDHLDKEERLDYLA